MLAETIPTANAMPSDFMGCGSTLGLEHNDQKVASDCTIHQAAMEWQDATRGRPPRGVDQQLQKYGGLELAPLVQVKALCMIYKQRTRMASVPADVGCSSPKMIAPFAR